MNQCKHGSGQALWAEDEDDLTWHGEVDPASAEGP